MADKAAVKFTFDRRKLLNDLSPRSRLGDIIFDLLARIAALEARVAELENA